MQQMAQGLPCTYPILLGTPQEPRFQASSQFPCPPAAIDLSLIIGSAITIYGLTSSYCGDFTVTLDNITTTLSARSSYNNSNSLLFYATDLSQDLVHHITVINQESRTLALRAGGLNTTFFGNSTTYASVILKKENWS